MKATVFSKAVVMMAVVMASVMNFSASEIGRAHV